MRQETASKTPVGVACAAFFILSLFITAYSSRNPAVARIGNAAVMELIAPISEVAQTLRQGVSSWWGRYVFLVNTSQENEQLRLQIAQLQHDLSMADEFARENQRLKSLLRVASDSRVQGVAARVIGGDPSGWIKGIVVDRGHVHGVKEGMAVVHAQGVVGQVVSVSSNAARVLLVSDHASGVDVLHEVTRTRGVVEGAGEQVCELTFVTKDTQVKVGDAIITSGMDAVYPKGVLVGRVSQIAESAGALFQTIEVRPAVDFSRLEEVLIVSSVEQSAEPVVGPEAVKKVAQSVQASTVTGGAAAAGGSRQ